MFKGSSFALAVGLFSVSVVAAESVIEIRPGSEIRINADQRTVVRCVGATQGPSDPSRVCTIARDGMNYFPFHVKQNGKMIEAFQDIDSAIKFIQKLVAAGVCSQ